MGRAGVSSSFRCPLKRNELEQLYQVFLLLFLTWILSLCCGSLDTLDILYSPCITALMRSLIKLTSKLPMMVLAKFLMKVLKHNDTLTLSFCLVKSVRLTLQVGKQPKREIFPDCQGLGRGAEKVLSACCLLLKESKLHWNYKSSNERNICK